VVFGSLVFGFEVVLEVGVTCLQHHVPQDAAARVVAHVAAVVVFVEGGARDEGQCAHGTPGDLVARVALSADHHFPDDPQEKGVAVQLGYLAHNGEGQAGGQLG